MVTISWPFVLLALGLLFLVAEVFIPSGGLLGVLAFGCLGASLWQAFKSSSDLGIIILLIDVIAMPVVLAFALYIWPRTPMARRILLKPPIAEEYSVSQPTHRIDHLVGQLGRALTTLRPSGMVDFDGRRLDGLSEDGLIPSGALVLAVRVRYGQVVVRNAPEPSEDMELLGAEP